MHRSAHGNQPTLRQPEVFGSRLIRRSTLLSLAAVAPVAALTTGHSTASIEYKPGSIRPTAPSAVRATADGRNVTVRFSPSTQPIGIDLLAYSIAAILGGKVVHRASGLSSPIRFTLPRPGEYKFQVAAVTSTAWSIPSVASTTVRIAAKSAARRRLNFVESAGGQLTVAGQPHRLLFASANPLVATAKAIVSAAQSLGLNAVRLTDWIPQNGPVGIVDRGLATWRLIDETIAALSLAGMRAIIDLSTYRNLLLSTGFNPYTENWSGFLAFILNRTNTVSQIKYRDDPTIAYIAFAGEPAGPASGDAGRPTVGDLLHFYSMATEFWKNNGGRQLCSPGGWLYMDLPDQLGIPVGAITALPTVDLVAIHSYGSSDMQVGIPYLATQAQSAGKPWIDEEFGQPLFGAGSVSDSARASYFSAHFLDDDANHSSGEGFWNLGATTGAVGAYDVATGGPTATVVRARAKVIGST